MTWEHIDKQPVSVYLLIRRIKENYSTSADVNLVLIYYITLQFLHGRESKSGISAHVDEALYSSIKPILGLLAFRASVFFCPFLLPRLHLFSRSTWPATHRKNPPSPSPFPIEPGSQPVFFLLKRNFFLPPFLGHESGSGFLLSAYRES